MRGVAGGALMRSSILGTPELPRSGREGAPKDTNAEFPGLAWLRQPTSYSDREWILEIAQQYRLLTLSKSGTV